MQSLSRDVADNPRILVVEENANLATGLSTTLTLEGYQAITTSQGQTVVRILTQHVASLVLLELNLQDIDGLSVLQDIRQQGHTVPVIVVTTRVDEGTRVAALRLGADDFVAKPFGVMELLERIKIQLRRTTPLAAAQRVRIGRTTFDFDARHVTREGDTLQLRPKEFDLLSCLWSAAGRVVSKAQLLREVWGFNCEVETRTLDFHVKSLRGKIEPNPAHPEHLLTVRGIGYRLIA